MKKTTRYYIQSWEPRALGGARYVELMDSHTTDIDEAKDFLRQAKENKHDKPQLIEVVETVIL